MTRRLFAYIGLSMLITFSVVFYFGIYGAVCALSSAVVIFIFALLKADKSKKRVFILISAAIILSMSYFQVYSSIKEINTQKYMNKSVSVTAEMRDFHRTRDYYFYELSCKTINSTPEAYKILLKTSSDVGAEYGDIITCDVNLNRINNNYYKSRNFDYSASPVEYILNYKLEKSKDRGILYIPVFIRDKLTYSLSVMIPGYAGELCNTVTLGDKYQLSENVYKQFRATGLTYLIVISGLHMSLAASLIYFLTKRLKRKRAARIIRVVSIVLFILTYIAVTGFTPSAMRSGIMIIVLYIGGSLRFKADTVNSLGFAAVLLTAGNPLAVGDVGMLMSFSSTAGILFIHPYFERFFETKFGIRIKNQLALKEMAADNIDILRISFKLFCYRLLRTVYVIFTVSICAVIAITPLTLMFYGIANPFVIIYSVFVSPFISVLMFFSAFASVIWYIPFLSFLAYGLAVIAQMIAVWILTCVGMISRIPYVTFYSYPELMKLWLLCTFIIFAFVIVVKLNRRNIIIASGLSVFILTVNVCAGYIMNYDKTELRVIPAGNGSTILFKSPEGVDLLSSGGSASMYDYVSEELHRNTDSFNLFVVQSSWEKPDVRFAPYILGEFDVEKVLLYYRYNTSERVYRLASEKDYRIIKDNESVDIRLSENVTDKIFNVNGHTYQYITDGETSALIAPNSAKAYEIPSDIKPDYLILNKEIKNLDRSKFGKVIWCSNKYVPKNLGKAALAKSEDYTISFK